MKKYFFPVDLPGQLFWHNGFRSTLGPYATKYNITPTEVSAMDDDGDYLAYWFNVHEIANTFGQGLTGFKNELAYGPMGAAPSTPPSLGPLPVAPTAVLPGVFPRALALANRIKAHAAYTTADGEAMGLEGAEQSPVDVPNLKPELKPVVAGPNQVDIFWKKNRTQGVEIWVKRGAGAWMLLAFDTTTPKYVDTQAFPATTETWEYKAVYHYGGAQAGQWSEVESVQVKA